MSAGASDSVAQITEADFVNVTQHLQCAKSAVQSFPHRSSWRSPPHQHLCCVSDHCFRSVHDGIIGLPIRKWRVGERVRFRHNDHNRKLAGWSMGRVAKTGPPLWVRRSNPPRETLIADDVRPLDELLDEDDAAIVEKVHAALEAQLRLVSLGNRRPQTLVRSVVRRQTISPTEARQQANAWHADYYENPWAVYSAILYTGHDDKDPLVGGWTGFVDLDDDADAAKGGRLPKQQPSFDRLPNGSVVLNRGMMVAPRIGRLVLFSAGGENHHAPLPVLRGRRQSIQMWFECRC